MTFNEKQFRFFHPLCEAFPSLFAFAVSQDAWVEDCWDYMGDAGEWNPCFSRSFNDWELEAVASLLSVLQGKRLNVGMEDRVVWNASKNGSFSVKSLYNTLDSGGAVPFPWRIIWSPCVPTKVGFFAWEASWGKVLTQDHLKRRGWSLANRCFLCCDDEETINHILIHCPKAKVLWNLMFTMFRVNWVLQLTVKDILLGWSDSFVDKKRGKIWRAAPLCLFWTMWKARNRIAFDNEALSIQRLKISFVCNLFSWSKTCLDGELRSLINFVDWLGSN